MVPLELTMGIPYYVTEIIRKHPKVKRTLSPTQRLPFDIFAIDFNCFIHKVLRPENPVGSVVVALHEFLTTRVDAKVIYIAFDGLVPYAKMVQQRYRRMRKETPSDEPGPRFDKNQISPGTKYMRELEEAIRFCLPSVLVSGTGERGEGEHKIFLQIRSMLPETRKTIGIYGLDADLVLIALAQHTLGNITLFRDQEDTCSGISIPELVKALPVSVSEFVEMSLVLFGNDFMPTVAMFSLRASGYERALHCYKGGDMRASLAQEDAVLKKYGDLSKDGYALEERVAIHLLDGVLDWDQVVYAFWKTYHWTKHYFYTSEVLDWCWYYPYAEAPLMKTLSEYDEPTFKYEWNHPVPPFTIADQLRFIMPSRSLLEDTPLFPDEIYDEATETRPLWMKKYAWESDPLISLPWNPDHEPTTVVWLAT